MNLVKLAGIASGMKLAQKTSEEMTAVADSMRSLRLKKPAPAKTTVKSLTDVADSLRALRTKQAVSDDLVESVRQKRFRNMLAKKPGSGRKYWKNLRLVYGREAIKASKSRAGT